MGSPKRVCWGRSHKRARRPLRRHADSNGQVQPGDGHMGAGESWMLYSQRGVVFSGVEFGQTRTFVCSVDRVMSVVCCFQCRKNVLRSCGSLRTVTLGGREGYRPAPRVNRGKKRSLPDAPSPTRGRPLTIVCTLQYTAWPPWHPAPRQWHAVNVFGSTATVACVSLATRHRLLALLLFR